MALFPPSFPPPASDHLSAATVDFTFPAVLVGNPPLRVSTSSPSTDVLSSQCNGNQPSEVVPEIQPNLFVTSGSQSSHEGLKPGSESTSQVLSGKNLLCDVRGLDGHMGISPAFPGDGGGAPPLCPSSPVSGLIQNLGDFPPL